jgi:hypothetical protein
MNWIEQHPLIDCVKFIRQVSELISLNGGELSWELNKLIQEGKYLEVIDYGIDYRKPYALSDLRGARQIKALVEKQAYLDLGCTPEETAYKKFKESEVKCLETNKRLELGHSPNGDVAAVLFIAQRKIDKILGHVPSLDALDFTFGPGATTNVNMREACFRSKLSARLKCSDDMIPIVGEFLAEFPYLVKHHCLDESSDSSRVLVQTDVGKLCFVPKNSKTDRPIVVEPLLNGFMQKGIGSYLKKRLKLAGIDLADQTRNQSLAFKGSVNDKLATIDLASASDTVSLSLVFDLLPPAWVDLLSSCRTGEVRYNKDGTVFTLEKFSSMGNGYTFELESLIFYGLAFGVCSHLGLGLSELSVYGDDIIIPSQAYGLLGDVLSYTGFERNEQKSFCSGPFRESCGADFWHGFDIRPFYLREKISDRILYSFHNWAVRNCEHEIASLVRDWTNPELRLFGPDGFGDGHLIGSHRLRLNRTQRRAGWGGGFFDSYSLKKRFFKKLLPGDWLVPSYSVYTRSGELDPTDPDLVRGSRGYAKMSIYTLTTSIFRRA